MLSPDERGGVEAMKLLAIDPGNEESAFVVYDTKTQLLAKPYGLSDALYDSNENYSNAWPNFGKWPNAKLLEAMRGGSGGAAIEAVVIEMIASYGMPVGREVFETCLWIGRFLQRVDWMPERLVYRRDVKLHLCGSMKAKDANIRQALIDRYGGKEKAIGNKKSPGPLYGVSADVWSALAIAVTWSDTQLRATEAA